MGKGTSYVIIFVSIQKIAVPVPITLFHQALEQVCLTDRIHFGIGTGMLDGSDTFCHRYFPHQILLSC